MWMTLKCDLNSEEEIATFKKNLINTPSTISGLCFDFKNLDFEKHEKTLKLIASWIPPHISALKIGIQEVVLSDNTQHWKSFIATLPIDTLSFFWEKLDSEIQSQHVTAFLLFVTDIVNIKKIIFPDLSSKKSVKSGKHHYDLSPLLKLEAITSWKFCINTEEEVLFFLTWLSVKPVIERLHLATTTARLPAPEAIIKIAKGWGNRIKELELEHFLGEQFFRSVNKNYNIFKEILDLESLSLRNNALENYELFEHIAFLNTLPKNLYHLSLAKNFCAQNIEKLKDLLPHLPYRLEVLDLSENDLSTIDEEFFFTLPPNIHTIKLSHTYISSFRGLPASVKTVVYSHQSSINWRLNPKEFAAFLRLIATIPCSVSHLDLSHNVFNKLSQEQLKQLNEAIPQHVRQVYLGGNDLFIDKTYSQLESTIKTLENDKTITLYGESTENYVARAREKWRRVGSYTKPSSLIELDNFKKNNTQESNLLLLLSGKVGLAVSEYKSWSIDRISKRGPEGWFSRWRHGLSGIERAEELSTAVEQCTNPQDVIEKINKFLKDKHTRFHNHSFACFLLDQLTTLKEMDWNKVYATEYPRYKTYPEATIN